MFVLCAKFTQDPRSRQRIYVSGPQMPEALRQLVCRGLGLRADRPRARSEVIRRELEILSSRGVAIDRSQCCRAGYAADHPRGQYGGRRAVKDDPLLLERVSQLSRFGQVGGRDIERQEFDAQVTRALL